MEQVVKSLALKVTPKSEQPQNYFYVLKMSAKKLAAMKLIPVRYPTERKGIQRLSDEKRIKEIANYIINREASFPNSIIVSFTGDVKINSVDSLPDLYMLEIPVIPKQAIIIDGQHRLLGIERSGVDMEILVTAFLNIPVEKQAAIFRDINFYQRKVNKSLMYDLFHVAKDAEYSLMRAIDLTERLNEGGPLEGRIKLTGVGEGVVTQTIFVETIEQFLKDDEIFRQPEYEEVGSLEIQLKVLNAFYESLRGNYKNVWEDPKSYVLLKTQGIYATLMLLRDLLRFFHKNRGGFIPSARDFEPYTASLASRVSFEREKYGDAYLGAGGQRRLHQLLSNTVSKQLRD
jgi:DGQHR domain-containing protein